MSHKREKSIFSQEIVILKSRSGCFSKILFSLTCELAHETALTNTTYIFLKKEKEKEGYLGLFISMKHGLMNCVLLIHFLGYFMKAKGLAPEA